MSKLKEIYEEKIVPEFLNSGYKNKLAVPKVKKVVLNCGIGKFRDNPKMVEMIKNNLALITGQMPAVRKSKKAIAGFKVRTGEEVGLTVTLRGEKMYDFLFRLANTVLPRVRDFRGVSKKSFGKSGNLTLGIREHIIFPEVSHQAENIHGLEISIVTTAKTPAEGEKLLAGLGLPFTKKEQKNG